MTKILIELSDESIKLLDILCLKEKRKRKPLVEKIVSEYLISIN